MSTRLEKVEKALKQEVGSILAYDMNDPRIGFTTVTYVEVAADIRSARVHVGVIGDEKTRKGTMAAIGHAKGYIQKEVASRLRMKYTPTLSFYIDDGPEKSAKMMKLIDGVMAESRKDEDNGTEN
jgi:ribosome-binding factor A